MVSLSTSMKAHAKTVETQVPLVKNPKSIAEALAANTVAQNAMTAAMDLPQFAWSNLLNLRSNLAIVNGSYANLSPADQQAAKSLQDQAKAPGFAEYIDNYRLYYEWLPNSPLTAIGTNMGVINTIIAEKATSITTVARYLTELFDTNTGYFRDTVFKTTLLQDISSLSLATQLERILKVQQSLAVIQPKITIGSNTLVITSAMYGGDNVTGFIAMIADKVKSFQLPSHSSAKVSTFNINGTWTSTTSMLSKIYGVTSGYRQLTISYAINGVTQNKTFTRIEPTYKDGKTNNDYDPLDLGKDINIDCVIGWSTCTNTDPLATTGTQTYGVTTEPFGTLGKSCSDIAGQTSTTRACVMPVVNCSGSFGAETACLNGVQSKIYSIVTKRSGAGLECPHPNGFIQTSNCKPIVDCVGAWSGWGDCDPTSSTQAATYSVVTEASGGGTACPATDGQTKSRACKPDQPAPQKAVGLASTEKSFFEQYGLILGGGCCCCIVLLLIFFMMKKGPPRSSV